MDGTTLVHIKHFVCCANTDEHPNTSAKIHAHTNVFIVYLPMREAGYVSSEVILRGEA
jgi:hypothetical protein